MDVAMVAQVILSPEALVTDLAGVGPFVGVCSLVYEEVVRFSEVASTKTTNKLLTRPEISSYSLMATADYKTAFYVFHLFTGFLRVSLLFELFRGEMFSHRCACDVAVSSSCGFICCDVMRFSFDIE